VSVVDCLPDASVYFLDASHIPLGADVSNAGGMMLVARAARRHVVGFRPAWRHVLAWAVAACLAPSCTAAGGDAVAQTNPQSRSVGRAEDLLIVDCLLPPQIRRLGQQVTYLSARQAVKTAARDCEIRGGEYVAFDRANYATALRVWLPLAEGGDPAAQTNVGEIFEKGLGVLPDYAAAAVWYRRGAERGSSRAAINLGQLYEQGHGVPKDPVQALGWYRKAAGLGDLPFGLAATSAPPPQETQQLRVEVAQLRRQLDAKQAELTRAQRDLEALRGSLETRLNDAKTERDALARLRRQLEAALREQLVDALRRGQEQTSSGSVKDLEKAVAEREARLAARDRDVAELKSRLTVSEAASTAKKAEVDRLQKDSAAEMSRLQRDAAARSTTATTKEGSSSRSTGQAVGLPRPKDLGAFGNYHALVIGNDEYRQLPRLNTAVNDARDIDRILKASYSFKVTLLLNADRYQILSTLNGIRERLTDKDNLLIYYAGHGELDRKNQRGHWLPVDAEPNSSANWISNIVITDILNAMNVQQLLVVADSCYAGTLTRSSVGRLDAALSETERLKVIQLMARKRSRMVMTSGGLGPVVDSVGGSHSVFAQPFIELLQTNVGVLSGQEMFRQLQIRVAATAQRVDAQQVPEYAPIKFAGHEAGDFFFVRASN
jgi:archaellum component FlaC